MNPREDDVNECIKLQSYLPRNKTDFLRLECACVCRTAHPPIIGRNQSKQQEGKTSSSVTMDLHMQASKASGHSCESSMHLFNSLKI